MALLDEVDALLEINVRAVDPLNHAVPIVDQHGMPTPVFMRQWAATRTIGLAAEANAVAASAIDTALAGRAVPFYTAAGVLDEIPLTSGAEIPFFRADGVQDNIPVLA